MNEELPPVLETDNEPKGIILYEESIISVGVSMDNGGNPDKCIVLVSNGDDFMVSPDFLQLAGFTMIPSSISNYEEPGYRYEDPPADVVMLTDEKTRCFVVKTKWDDIGVACFEENDPLETIDAGETDEIYEDAREIDLGWRIAH